MKNSESRGDQQEHRAWTNGSAAEACKGATAPGGPGSPGRWTTGAKQGVGTAYSAASRVWFTLADGIVTEVYAPTVDRPQIRDAQLVITDGTTFVHEERRDLVASVGVLSRHALGYRVVSVPADGRYRLTKEIICDPHQACVLLRIGIDVPDAILRARLRAYLVVSPHLAGTSAGNSGEMRVVAGHRLLTAHREHSWLAIGAAPGFQRLSCGYVGVNDGRTDLARSRKMEFQYCSARDGNIALTGELGLDEARECTIALALADCPHGATTALLQSLGTPFASHRQRFIEQWERGCVHQPAMQRQTGDEGTLYHLSQSLLLAHEDKSYPGAIIASLSIPWGDAQGDENLGGYHLVWTRDMVNSATGLLAAGNPRTPLRALIYLAASQQPDGGFFQNFFVSGEPYWRGVQLDEVAFPILLARRLHEMRALELFDPYAMVLRAAGFLVRNGPATAQERWEEASGYSPSTLAVTIAALICSAAFARERGEVATAQYLEEYADFLEHHVEAWTVTSVGTLLLDVPRHYIRIHPVRMDDVQPDENPDWGMLHLANQPPGEPDAYPAREIVDAGFLELVRYGIRKPGDPIVEDSLRVVDAVLRVDTPAGPAWRRYNHDGYGQRSDGGPYLGWGQGRPWPLLTGERGHYELASGRSVAPYLRAMERFTGQPGLLPEQVWDGPDSLERRLKCGGPTDAAMPLMWAHAEYLKLVRSAADGEVFDRIPAVAERYHARSTSALEVWKPNRQVAAVRPGMVLRIQRPESFWLRWTTDEWRHGEDVRSTPTALGIEFVDIALPADQRAPVQFTFRRVEDGVWHGRDYIVAVAGAAEHERA